MEKITQAVILAGGRGTRLGDSAGVRPKSLVDIGGRPFLDVLLERLATQGITKALLLCGYRAKLIIDHYSQGTHAGIILDFVVEPSPLGTGGALLNAHDMLDDRFALLNGDTYFEVDLEKLNTHLPPGMTCALVHEDNTARYGSVKIVGSKITSLEEKGQTGPGLINGGFYIINKSILAPHWEGWCGQFTSFETDLLPDLVSNGLVHGQIQSGVFIDIGLPESLEYARQNIFA